ncbi:MAG: TRAP transporter TatT component family protein [Pseudomonadota bacterium]
MKKILVFSALLLSLSGCSTLMSSAATGLAENVSGAMFNQVDPETAKDALPTFIVLLDSFLQDDPYDADILSSGAQMYATYGAVFADDEVRASRLTTRGRKYAQTAMCVSYEPACNWPGATYDEFVATLDGIERKNAEYLFTYGFASLAYLRAHAADWNSLAELPQVGE